jgi:riboflavin synthase
MFTGLVEQVGTIERVERTEAGRTFRIGASFDALVDGESVAVNGACLTVRERAPGWFAVAAVVTTLDRTTIGNWAEGTRVNLERALRVGDRFGGHFVQGHVDGVAEVREVRQQDDARLIDLALPAGLPELMVPHGSLAVDGVSLTVNGLPAPTMVQVSLIEYTLRHTTLGALRAGDRVHVEGDMLGKYVRRMLDARLSDREKQW